MPPSEYPVVGVFQNDTNEDMFLYLEMTCEVVILAPGHMVELLAEPAPELLPLTILGVTQGLQIYSGVGNPDWHIRFQGKLIKPTYTHLSDEATAARSLSAPSLAHEKQ